MDGVGVVHMSFTRSIIIRRRHSRLEEFFFNDVVSAPIPFLLTFRSFDDVNSKQ